MFHLTLNIQFAHPLLRGGRVEEARFAQGASEIASFVSAWAPKSHFEPTFAQEWLRRSLLDASFGTAWAPKSHSELRFAQEWLQRSLFESMFDSPHLQNPRKTWEKKVFSKVGLRSRIRSARAYFGARSGSAWSPKSDFDPTFALRNRQDAPKMRPRRPKTRPRRLKTRLDAPKKRPRHS